MNYELVVRTQPSGPLCLWQCFYLSRLLDVANASSMLQFDSDDIAFLQKHSILSRS